MKQRVVITVLPADRAAELLSTVQQRLIDHSLLPRIESLMQTEEVLFFSDHLDLWSMGDTFDRLLRPKAKLHVFRHQSDVLYAIPRRSLVFRHKPRDFEEFLLCDLLRFAKTNNWVTPDSWLFLLRRVLGTSPG